MLRKLGPEVCAVEGSEGKRRATISLFSFAPVRAALSLLARGLACAYDWPAEGTPRCEPDPGVLGTQVAWRIS